MKLKLFVLNQLLEGPQLVEGELLKRLNDFELQTTKIFMLETFEKLNLKSHSFATEVQV